ncbi:MAG: hypothetical protein ABI824_06335 [Acidobacteriota bacterium]
MRTYSESNEEALRARSLLRDWAGEGFLNEAQYKRMEQETVCDLRRTNIFLRVVMFFFTVIVVVAVVGLLFLMFDAGSSQPSGVLFLVFAAISYAAAEKSASRGLYRHGIEEAFAVCSVGLGCLGLFVFLDRSDGTEFLIPTLGALSSLWIWHRFGLAYVFVAAMIFVAWLATSIADSHSGQHLFVAAVYTVGLIGAAAVRGRYRLTYLKERYSIAEALLWLGIYLAFNLQLSSADLLREWLDVHTSMGDFAGTFYWITWGLTWCIPPVVLYRGIRTKDRYVMAVGGITMILTLVTNKAYLGWPRHTWDPMLLGTLLIGVAILLQRWLAKGENGIRNGFTAQRLSGNDKGRMSAVSVAFGLAAPQATSVNPEASDFHFGGGSSGGGGASGEF